MLRRGRARHRRLRPSLDAGRLPQLGAQDQGRLELVAVQLAGVRRRRSPSSRRRSASMPRRRRAPRSRPSSTTRSRSASRTSTPSCPATRRRSPASTPARSGRCSSRAPRRSADIEPARGRGLTPRSAWLPPPIGREEPDVTRFILRRLLLSLVTLWLLATIVFIITNVLPNDVGRTILGPFAPQESVDALNEKLGTDDPLIEQYVRPCASSSRSTSATRSSPTSRSCRRSSTADQPLGQAGRPGPDPDRPHQHPGRPVRRAAARPGRRTAPSC